MDVTTRAITVMNKEGRKNSLHCVLTFHTLNDEFDELHLYDTQV
jgi:hypothetical protein